MSANGRPSSLDVPSTSIPMGGEAYVLPRELESIHDARRPLTIADATTLLVTVIRMLSAARAECDGYRLLAQQAIHLLHTMQLDARRLGERYGRLLDECRDLRKRAIRNGRPTDAPAQ